MNPEEKDALWDLLGKADRRPDVSPTFAQDVTRKVRQLDQPKSGRAGFFGRLFGANDGDTLGWLRPAIAFGAVAVAVIVAVIVMNGEQGTVQPPPIVDNDPPEVEELVTDPALEVFENEMEVLDQFDTLLTVSDVDQLNDEQIAMLIY